MSIEDAFRKICSEATEAKRWYVSLYVATPYYGGPEEGCWWGDDKTLVAFQECTTESEAKDILVRVTALAETLTKEAKDAFNKRCLQECEWSDVRGLDSDFLPEVDGHEEYSVVIEQRAGSHEYQGPRHYE